MPSPAPSPLSPEGGLPLLPIRCMLCEPTPSSVKVILMKAQHCHAHALASVSLDPVVHTLSSFCELRSEDGARNASQAGTRGARWAGCRHAGLKSGQRMQNVTCSHHASGMRDPSPQKVRKAHLMGVS